jgi:CBS domain-containing protein
MNQHRIGAVIIAEDSRIVGIFTERDVLQHVIEEERRPAEIGVAEVMTREVVCCTPDTPIDEASRILRDRRIRHLPVCDPHGHLLGLVSIGDINAHHASDQATTIHYLHEYLYGSA